MLLCIDSVIFIIAAIFVLICTAHYLNTLSFFFISSIVFRNWINLSRYNRFMIIWARLTMIVIIINIFILRKVILIIIVNIVVWLFISMNMIVITFILIICLLLKLIWVIIRICLWAVLIVFRIYLPFISFLHNRFK